MEINLNAFLEALNKESAEIKKIAAHAVLDYRKTRSPVLWNAQLENIISYGVSRQRLSHYFLEE